MFTVSARLLIAFFTLKQTSVAYYYV